MLRTILILFSTTVFDLYNSLKILIAIYYVEIYVYLFLFISISYHPLSIAIVYRGMIKIYWSAHLCWIPGYGLMAMADLTQALHFFLKLILFFSNLIASGKAVQRREA